MTLEFELRGPACVNSPKIRTLISHFEGADGIKLVFELCGQRHEVSLSNTSAKNLAEGLTQAASSLRYIDQWEREGPEA